MLRAARLSATLAGLLLICAASLAAAHSFYAALTRIAHNPRNGTLEIMHRLATHDLEAVLSFQEERRMSFDQDFQELSDLAKAYIDGRFSILADGAPVPLAFVGVDVAGDQATIWYEGAVDGPPSTLEVTNRIFTKDLPDQRNMVIATIGGQVFSGNFSEDNPARRLNIAEQSP